MPTYAFRSKQTGQEHEAFMTFSQKDQYLADNPDLEQIIVTAPALHSGAGLGVRKVDDGFNDVLKAIAKRNPNNNIKLK